MAFYDALEAANRVAAGDERPDVTGAETLLTAFVELSTERVNGMSAGAIPISKIWEYCDRFGLDDWALTYQISVLDREILARKA